MSARLPVVAMSLGCLTACQTQGFALANGTGDAVWIVVDRTDGLVEEVGMVPHGGTVDGLALADLERVEYRYGQNRCALTQADLRTLAEISPTVVLAPCPSGIADD